MPDNPAFERLQAALADRYRIERELGTGGMATVYLAEDLRLSRKVALKVLRPELADSLSAGRLSREIAVSASLEHPHIVPLYDSGEAGGALYYTMTFVEGMTLRERLQREGQLPVGEAVRITRELASALAYAHERGVVHRDIKPENILLREGHALVADFGVARAVSVAGGERLTRTGIAVGSPLYMSPEQASGVDLVDGRTDQYSLACVTYEMLAGEAPLGGRTLQTILARRMTERPTSLHSIRSSVTPELEAAVLRAMDRTPADRYPDIGKFADAVARAAEESPGAGTGNGTRRRRRKARVRVAGIAVGAVLLLTAVRFGWLQPRNGLPWVGPSAAEAGVVPGVAVLPFAFIGPDSVQPYVADAAAMKLAQAFRQTGVPSPNWSAVERFKDSVPELPVVGRYLGVSYVLQGVVLVWAGGLELSVELVRTSDSQLVWRQTFSGLTEELSDFEIQIAQAAADSVAVYAGLPVGRLIVARYTEDPVADGLYTRALYLSNQEYDPASGQEIVDLTSAAIERDPAFAPAYVLLASGLSGLSRIAWRVPPGEQEQRVRELLERALEIDPDYAWAGALYGWYYYQFAWEWEASLAMLERAIDLEPTGAEPHVIRAFPLIATGDVDGAVASVRKGTELEPHNPLFVSTECWILYLAHRYQESIDRCQFVIDSISSDHPAANAIRRASEFALTFLEGEPTEAEREASAQGILAGMPPVEERQVWSEIGEPVLLAMLGRRDEALRVLKEEIPRQFFRPLRAANTYAWAGDMDEAWSWLEKAYEQRDPYLAESAVRPEMAPFREDGRRWPAFAARMNLD